MRLDLKESDLPEDSRIRRISTEDVEPLAKLLLESYRGTVDEEESNIDEALAEVQKTFDGDYGRFVPEASFLLEDKGRFASASLITIFQGEPLLAFSLTHPDFQRRGFAARLIGFSAEAVRKSGRDSLFLFVTKANLPAVSLYRKLGFMGDPNPPIERRKDSAPDSAESDRQTSPSF